VSAWREIDLANGAFGQGIAVTPIQLARAYAAMVNGGQLVTPHVVASVGDREATIAAAPQVIAAEHGPTLTWMLNHVVTAVKQYAVGTLVPDHFVGGKTGTAQIWDAEAGAWKDSTYHFSFVGYIGRRIGQPELIVAVRITELRPTVLSAGVYEMPIKSWELFRRVAMDAIAIPGLLPELPPAEPVVAIRG
jgi:cell division protein FtsI/penicillin-binding protein 2